MVVVVKVFYREAMAKGTQVYITGDIYYHTAQEMITNGMLAIDPGHHIEVLMLINYLRNLMPGKMTIIGQ